MIFWRGNEEEGEKCRGEERPTHTWVRWKKRNEGIGRLEELWKKGLETQGWKIQGRGKSGAFTSRRKGVHKRETVT